MQYSFVNLLGQTTLKKKEKKLDKKLMQNLKNYFPNTRINSAFDIWRLSHVCMHHKKECRLNFLIINPYVPT